MKKIQKGFTLIELLVVMAIIGILAAIAIPQFASYRQRGFDSAARSDLRNAATGEEAYFVDNQEYVSCADAAACEGDLPGVRMSRDTVIAMVGAPTAFTGESSHPSGTGREFCWDSDQQGELPVCP